MWDSVEDMLDHFDPVIKAIARKYSPDESLLEDCWQEARMALLTVDVTKIDYYGPWRAGEISDEKWKKRVGAYCRSTIKYRILNFLNNKNTGSWQVGRNRKDKYIAPIFSLDTLYENGMQVDTDGEVSWETIESDGLDA